MARSLALLGSLLVAGIASAASAGGLDRIEQLVRAGRNEAALVAIAEAPPALRERADVRYLTARLFSRIGEHEAALAAMPPTGELPEGVRADVALERALLEAELGRCGDALPVLREARRHAARLSAARCALALGEHEAALALTEETVARDPLGVDLLEVRLLRAEAELARDRPERAIEELRAAWIERPEHARIGEVEAALAEIPGGARRLDAAARIARAGSLLERRRFRAALEALDELPSTERSRLEARRLRGRALFSIKRYGEAASLLSATARGGGSEGRKDELLAARARYRSGDKAGGMGELRRVARKHRGTYEGDLAAYLIADVTYDRGGPKGEAALRRFLESPAASRLPRKAQRARFRMGLRAFEAGRGAEALRQFRAYEEGARDLEERLAGWYWGARALAQLGKREAAAASFTRLAARYPFDWYGYHARRRLHAMDEAARLEEHALPPLPEAEPPPFAPEESEAVAFYRRLGLVADAEAKLREALSDEPQARLAFHLARADVRSAFLVARAERALFEPIEAMTRWIWEAAYPRPHREHVSRIAEEAGVPEAWVYATMRQESGFHADARSRAGAQGLLQLLPAVAADVAAAAGVDLESRSLLEPEVNLALGVELMRRLGARVGGKLPLMAAAYNAGPGRLVGWLEQHGGAELDLFVERVPFEESRRYVKRVVSHYFVYRYLGGEPDPFEGAIPEKIERP